MTLKRIATVLLRHWAFVALLTVLMVVPTAFVVLHQSKHYRATTLLEVQAPVDSDGSISLQGANTARERAVTISALGGTGKVGSFATRRLPPSIGPYSCSFSQVGQSEFIRVACSSTRRRDVALLANVYANALQAFLEAQRQDRINELSRQYKAQIRELRTQGVPPQNFPTPPVFPNLRELQIIDSAATPSFPYAPNPVRDILIALVLGLLVNSALAFLLEYVQDRAHAPEEIQSALGEPILGVVPGIRRKVYLPVVSPAPAREPFAGARRMAGERP